MKYIIRKLEPPESKLYRAIRLESLKIYPEWFGSKYEEQIRLSKMYFEKIIEDNAAKGMMFGSFFKGELIGICGVTFETKITANAGEIIQMYVQKKYQGNKLGIKLIRKIQTEVKQVNGIDTLILGVEKNNLAAIKTYLNCGFEVIENFPQKNNVQYMRLSLK